MTMKATTNKQASEQNENVIDFGMEQPFNICANIINKVNDIYIKYAIDVCVRL